MSEKDKFFVETKQMERRNKKCELSVYRHTPAIVAIHIERYHDVKLEDDDHQHYRYVAIFICSLS